MDFCMDFWPMQGELGSKHWGNLLAHPGGTAGPSWGNRSAAEPEGIPLESVRTPSGKPGWGMITKNEAEYIHLSEMRWPIPDESWGADYFCRIFLFFWVFTFSMNFLLVVYLVVTRLA